MLHKYHQEATWVDPMRLLHSKGELPTLLTNMKLVIMLLHYKKGHKKFI
jgi:hypothetical protein